jgi:hypothetical protein
MTSPAVPKTPCGRCKASLLCYSLPQYNLKPNEVPSRIHFFGVSAHTYLFICDKCGRLWLAVAPQHPDTRVAYLEPSPLCPRLKDHEPFEQTCPACEVED